MFIPNRTPKFKKRTPYHEENKRGSKKRELAGRHKVKSGIPAFMPASRKLIEQAVSSNPHSEGSA